MKTRNARLTQRHALERRAMARATFARNAALIALPLGAVAAVWFGIVAPLLAHITAALEALAPVLN